MNIPPTEPIMAAVRAFATRDIPIQSNPSPAANSKKQPEPSEYALIFDTETTTDHAQNLRFGTYQVRKHGELQESGVFYAPEILTSDEIKCLQNYADEHDLHCMKRQVFIDEVFYRYGYLYRGTIVGFNLPFDISRLAVEHAPARSNKRNKIMKSGFTFKLSENPYFPRVQIKHISSRNAFIQFATPKGQRTSRGKRKKQLFQPARRGFFLDIKTLAAALTSRSHSLDSLTSYLSVESKKLDTDQHGQALTDEYIEYAVRDTQATWECYKALAIMYAGHGLTQTQPHKILSEASLGKAYLKEMGICPWRECQPDFPPELLGQIMSAYYGGRSEVHIRKTLVQVLYSDFLSMYPTVCTLMGLWRFVTADGMDWVDSTDETRELLETITVDQLQDPATWNKLTTLVEIKPEGDAFPVRAKYGRDKQYTIGANYLTSDSPLMYTLADCIASKLLTGRTPQICRAITFSPREPQQGLQAVCVAGNEEYTVDPSQGDFFKQIIDQRRAVKAKMKGTSGYERSFLDSQQQSLKILANSTSYGIFVELNVEEEKVKQDVLLHGHDGVSQPIKMNKFEEPGKYFHPLLATLITGAARLMLAITERLILDEGLDWAFCDTDSMAIAKPEGMDQETFYAKAQKVRDWFTPLNPYEQPGSLLKAEDENYSLTDEGQLEPLYCYAISSKRYALFNKDHDGRPILRKVSEHGLGHLMAPHEGSMSPLESSAKNWKDDIWLEIILAAQEGRHSDYSKLPQFKQPAVSRYGATSPQLLGWFKEYNKDKPYLEQVKPFNFLLSLQARHDRKELKPAAAFCKDIAQAAENCFDRATGNPIDNEQLKTYQESLAQYHLHPETKFLNGDYLDSGLTQRRHMQAVGVAYIGKEANKWEEQFFTGLISEAQLVYGSSEESLDAILKAINKYGIKRMADVAKISVRHVHNIYHQKTIPKEKTLAKLLLAGSALNKVSDRDISENTKSRRSA